jgi:hypothetical protein
MNGHTPGLPATMLRGIPIKCEARHKFSDTNQALSFCKPDAFYGGKQEDGEAGRKKMAAPQLEVVGSAGSKNPIYNSVKRFSLDGLSDLIRVLMESVDDALFELSDKVANDRERNMYFEAMREIRLKRDALKQHFDFEMKQRFDQFISGKSASDDFDDEEELTLVELDDLEDAIAIDNMISKARPNFEDDLFAVTERLKLVLRRKQIDEDQSPIDPKAICDSFHKASDLLDTDIQVKLIFYKLFDRYVMNNLGHFYKEGYCPVSRRTRNA